MTGRELERGDARAPVERAAGLQVLGRVPEGAVVYGVNRDGAVIAPAAERRRLRAGAGDDARLRAESAGGVARRARREAYGRLKARARNAVADRDVAHLVHRNRTHPTAVRVYRVRPLLEDARRTRRDAQLVPTDAGQRAGAGVDRVVDDQSLVPVGEVAIGEALHQTVGQRVELLRSARLRDARPAAARLAEGRDRERGRPRERRVGGGGEVGVHLPDVGRVRTEVDEVFGRARGRRDCAVEVCGQHAAEARTQLEALLGGRGAGDHLRAVVGAEARADEAAPGKHVVGRVVAVGPDAELRVVVEVRLFEGVDVVGARRVRCLRDGDALVEAAGRPVGDGELRQHPAVVRLVVLGDGVAVVVDGARVRRAERGEQLVAV